MKTRRAKINLALIAAMSVSSAVSASAQGIQVRVNGEPVRFTGIGPQSIEGRVLVPLRGVLEKLGAHVGWVPSTSTVVASRGNMDMQLKIGSRTARVNGREVPLDVPAMMLAGSTMVPLRFVGETLGADVRWDNATQTVLIATNGGTGGQTQTEPVPSRPPNQEPGAPTIRSLNHNRERGWLQNGQALVVTMEGTSGGQASFRLPGLEEEVPMREMSPGVYRGQWTPPRDKPVQITGVSLLGSLKKDGKAAPLLQSGNPVQVDTARPRLADVTPARNSRVTTRRPLISVTYSDQSGSGMAAERTKILLDGRDITGASEVTGKFFTFRPQEPLATGQHEVDLTVYDRAGNPARYRWNFTVAATQDGIKSVTTNAQRTLEPGDVLDVRVEGAPGGRASFDLGTIKNRPLAERSPGVYVGSYTIRKGDDISSAPVAVTLISREGEKYTSTTDRSLQVKTGPPPKPKFLSPKDGDAITSPLVVRGTAAANSTIRLKVEYANPVIGGLAVRGTAAQVEISVDKNGNWQSEPLTLSSLFGSRNTKYTLTAVAISQNDEESEPVTLHLTRR